MVAKCTISIIIPAYNVEDYLDAALNSIIVQEESPDEIILIDDGSTDGTLSLAKSYSFLCPYKVISTKNMGQGNARNLGLSLATSEYIYFLDADDLIKKSFIKCIRREILNNNNPDILMFSGESFNDEKYQGSRWIDYQRGLSGFFSIRKVLLDKLYLSGGLFCQPCLYITKRDLWGDGRLTFDSNYLEDEAIFFPLLFACSDFVVLEDVFFSRRNREGSTMTVKPTLKHVNGALNCMRTALSLYTTQELTVEERWHIQKRIQSHCTAYILYCRALSQEYQFFELFKVLNATRSPELFFKMIVFMMRLDKFTFLKNIYKYTFSSNSKGESPRFP